MQNNLARTFCTFLAVTARQLSENAQFHDLREKRQRLPVV